MRKYFPYLVIAVIVVVLASFYLLFKTTTTVVELPIEETELNDAVTVTKGVTEIGRSFLSVPQLIWKGQVAYFVGESTDHKLGLYKFVGSSGGLYSLKPLPADQFDMKTDKIMEVLAGDALLIHRVSDGKICLRTVSGRIVTLAVPLEKPQDHSSARSSVGGEKDAAGKEGEKSYFVSVSSDGKKLAMLTADGKTVLAYDLTRGIKKQIRLRQTVLADQNHDVQMSISPSGEYFLMSDSQSRTWKESHLSVIGVDTGRYYVSDVVGIYPTWSPTEDRLSFLYTGELGANTLDKVRLGVLDCGTRKITYYDSGKTGTWFGRHTAWTGDGKTLVYLTYKKDATGVPQFALSRFDLVALSKKNFNIPVTLDPAETAVVLSGISIALDDVTNRVVHMVDAENNTIKTYSGVDAYGQGALGRTVRLTPSGDGFLGFDAEKLTNFSARGLGTAFDLTGYNGEFVVNGLGNGAALLDRSDNGQVHLKFVPLEKTIQ